MTHITRQFVTLNVKFATNTCETEPVDFGHYAGGMFQLPPAWDTTHVGFKISQGKDTIFYPLYDKDNALIKVTHPTPSYWYPLPDEIYGARHFKLWSVSNSTTDLNQTAVRPIVIMLKG